jgi:hypothetical protein
MEPIFCAWAVDIDLGLIYVDIYYICRAEKQHLSTHSSAPKHIPDMNTVSLERDVKRHQRNLVSSLGL